MSEYSRIPMFIEAPAGVFANAKYLRSHMTRAEFKLWNFLKGNNIFGLRFRAQHPLGVYIADFYCHKISMVIEVDGAIHDTRIQHENDLERSQVLNKWGIHIIRFSNNQVMNNFDFVQNEIIKEVKFRLQNMG